MLTESVRRCCLYTSTCSGDEAFDSGSEVGTGEFLINRLGAFDYGYGEKFLVYIGIPIKDLEDFFRGLLLSQMRCVAFLPEELARSDERHWMLELPSDNVVPLVQLQGEVSVRLDLAGEMRVHGGFRCGANGDGLLKVRLSAFGHPSDLSGESLKMFLLSLQIVGTDEDREVGIADFEGLGMSVLAFEAEKNVLTLILASNHALMFSQMA